MLGHNNIKTCGLACVFARTGPRHFGVTINCPWHSVVRNRNRTFAQHVLDRQNRFGVSNVCQLRSIDEVTNCIHARLRGLAPRINVNESTVADFDRSSLQSKKVGIGASTNRNDDSIDFKLFAFTERHNSATRCGWCMTLYCNASSDIDILFLERLHHDIGNVGVEAGKNFRKTFENRDGCAKVGKR